MRFCDLFISYKIGLKGIKNTIPFTKLPFYRKIAVILTFLLSVISIFMLLFKRYKIAFWIMFGALFLIFIFVIIDTFKRNLIKMLKNHYSPYSHKRMRMVIEVLEEYKIDISNTNLIDMLISEAEIAQIQCDYLTPLKKPLKTLGAIIIPIVVYIAKEIKSKAPPEDQLTLAILALIIILLIFSVFFALVPIAKDFLYRDYNKYDNFISDLRQIKIFYSNDKKNLVSIE